MHLGALAEGAACCDFVTKWTEAAFDQVPLENWELGYERLACNAYIEA